MSQIDQEKKKLTYIYIGMAAVLIIICAVSGYTIYRIDNEVLKTHQGCVKFIEDCNCQCLEQYAPMKGGLLNENQSYIPDNQ